MKLSILACAISVVMVTASPGASSLKRGYKWINVAGEVNSIQVACYECPCDGFSGKCDCIPQGCCCDWSQPTTTGWRGAEATAA